MADDSGKHAPLLLLPGDIDEDAFRHGGVLAAIFPDLHRQLFQGEGFWPFFMKSLLFRQDNKYPHGLTVLVAPSYKITRRKSNFSAACQSREVEKHFHLGISQPHNQPISIKMQDFEWESMMFFSSIIVICRTWMLTAG
jgi:hypothetical protein